MPRHWRLFTLAWLLILAGSLTAHWIQTAGGIAIKDLRFTGVDGRSLSALLYIPPEATPENPAPGVLAVHGYINSREVQAGFAIELARRGYVVLSLDQGGHGYSEPPAFAHGFGGPAALAYLRGLDIVDPGNIGLEGHSMGGWTVLAAAAAWPDGYHSMVLQGSSTGSGYAMEGTPLWPRNLAVVFAQYDEFAPLMWGVARGSEVHESDKLQTLFGTDQPVVEGRVYGDIQLGNARVLYNPAVTHPGNHLSHAAIGHTIDWFARTLEGGHAARGQIWFVRELATLTALIGFTLLLAGAFRLWLTLPWFAPMKHRPDSFAWTGRNSRWWALALISAALPVATYYPLFGLGTSLLPASALFPQAITNQIMVWALVTAALLLVPAAFIRTAPVRDHRSLGRAALISLATVGTAALAAVLAAYFFTVDFRFWFVGVKVPALHQFQAMLAYLLPFTVFFLLVLRGLLGNLMVENDSRARQYGTSAMVLAGGFALFLTLQYLSLFITGRLLTPAEPLNTIVMIQFVPLLLIVAFVSTYAWRRTASYLPGAFISALFVSWYITAGQATQYAGG